MPITYDRMLDLLIEAETHRLAFVNLRQEVTGTAYQHLHIKELQDLLTRINVLHPTPDKEAITRERLHYERFGTKNNTEKLRMRRKRQEQAQREGRNMEDRMTDEELIEHLKKQGKVFEGPKGPVQELQLIKPPKKQVQTPQAAQAAQTDKPIDKPVLIEPTLPGWERLKAANERFKQDTLIPLNVEETETDE